MMSSAAGGHLLPGSHNKIAALMHTLQVVCSPFPLMNLASTQNFDAKTLRKQVTLAIVELGALDSREPNKGLKDAVYAL